MQVNEFDRVKLHNGVIGSVVHVLEPGVAYYLDVGDGSEEAPWDNYCIQHKDIAEVIQVA